MSVRGIVGCERAAGIEDVDGMARRGAYTHGLGRP
jgi:hypothetical protein